VFRFVPATVVLSVTLLAAPALALIAGTAIVITIAALPTARGELLREVE
jgi:hypothetical protein